MLVDYPLCLCADNGKELISLAEKKGITHIYAVD